MLLDFGPIQIGIAKRLVIVVSLSSLQNQCSLYWKERWVVSIMLLIQTMHKGVYTWVNPNPNYAIAKDYKCFVGGAMPGFWDYYKEGEGGTGYQTYSAENGALFQRQLDAARQAGLKYLQISTWNDYGEGTTIEPTLEYGYKIPPHVAEVHRRKLSASRLRTYLSLVSSTMLHNLIMRG